MIAKGDVMEMVRKTLTPGQTAVDVGAATGDVCKVMRACVGPTGTVIAIEPRDTTIPYDVIRHTVACAGNTRTKPLYVPKGEGVRASLYRDAVLTKGDVETVMVPTAKLDDLVEYADLVKIDVQGAEMSVLSGAKRLLQTCPVWILEVWPHGLLCAGESLQGLWDKLHEVKLVPYTQHGAKIDYTDLSLWSMQRGSHQPFLNWWCKRA